MTPITVYTHLTQAQASPACDSFDVHVLASMFAIAAAEFDSGGSLAQGLGISGAQLRCIVVTYFPGAANLLEPFGFDRESTVADDEQCLRRLLLRSRTTPAPISTVFSIIIARRAMRPNHLWQDLGLGNRSELSRLMLRHFAPPALRNNQELKWKKFFYRIICRDDNTRMCVAPCCSECSDFEGCFSEESGESLLAQARLHLEIPGLICADSIVAA